MRVAFSKAVLELAQRTPELLFLTGDLGFNAFEELASQLGPRFINTGVAEQSAVGMAAGLAHRGHKVLVYSIAPFAVYRPLEQIRLDVCLHSLPVFIVGNGGGYGYGMMGATHHALEDLACLSCMPNMQCYIPAFDNDVQPILEQIFERGEPAYLRLGYGPPRQSIRPIPGLERIQSGGRLTAVALGPLIEPLLRASESLDVDLFCVRQLPLTGNLAMLWQSLARTRRLLVIEEHRRRGGLAEHLALSLLEQGISLEAVRSRSALGYPDGRYGSQEFHRGQCGLDEVSLKQDLSELLSL